MSHTRAETLRYSIAFALMKLKIHGRKGVLTEEDRYAVADQAIADLRKQGDQWRLDETIEIEMAPSWDWSKHEP